MTPVELIEEAETEIETRVRPRLQKIQEYIPNFREYLVNKGVAPLTVENRITGVKSFYRAFGIPINEIERQERTPTVLEQHKGIPDIKDIRKVLVLADPLEKALILVGLSSGLAINEICELRMSHFNIGYDKETGITTLSVRREKTDYDFVTFLTPEASSAVLEYINYRKRTPKDNSKKYKQLSEKQRVVPEIDSYLFIKRRIDFEYLETGNEELRKLHEDGIQEIYRRLCEAAGISADKGVWNLFRSHNMRKFFNNRLIAAKCDPTVKEFLMGHKIPNKTQASYFVDDPAVLRELYKDFIPFLTITEAYDATKDPVFKKMAEEKNALARVIEGNAVESKNTRDELEELRTQLDIERSERNLLETNIQGLVDYQMKQFRDQMEAGYNEMLEKMKRNLKE